MGAVAPDLLHAMRSVRSGVAAVVVADYEDEHTPWPVQSARDMG